ncbi:MAG: 7-cyano-7-deazaguanine synthase QueC [Blastopirellula sp.]|nr:MAG: 7-cyano-7-deazaguanine synthase QueC [Blastopirellula sp.]
MTKAYILLSGGIDSSALLARANLIHEGSVKAISVDYGQKHNIELVHAANVAKHMGISHEIVDMSFAMGKGGLSDPSLEVPKVSYEDLPHGVSPTYVPNRNMLMLSMLVSKAAADPDAEFAYYGAHAEDSENDAYPDCSPEFVNAMVKAVSIATYGKITLDAPFVDNTKAEVVANGEQIGVPWELTWSCYEGGLIHCGTCSTCRARRDAFIGARVTDPTVYREVPT